MSTSSRAGFPELAGTTGLVTGGASGIGYECARALLSAGARVAICDVDLDQSRRAAAELGDGIIGVAVDVRDATSCAAMVEQVIDEFGSLHFAVNNAGTGNSDKSLTADILDDEWDRVLSVNLGGVFRSMKAELSAMREGASIVNVSSVMGSVATRGAAAYVASKHGVVGLTKAAALDYAEMGIRINAVGPGYVRTPMLAHRNAEQLTEIGDRHPLGRLAEPAEIASAVVFLVSAGSTFMTGAYVPVDGGYTAR